MSNSLGTVTNACGGVFYDSNGPSTNYANNEASLATFCAPPGQYISFEFIEFETENFFDELIIYNGPNIASPIIGFYSGTDSPGTITSSLGGCITFDFASDESVSRPGWTANITCSSAPPSNGNACDGASPFCTGTTYNFPNNTGVSNLGTINCLFSTPNPVWYYFQIQNPGDLLIDISQEDGTGFGLDIDFNLWGPFASLPEGCTQISAGTAPSVDCSYSGAAVEQANAAGVLPGQVYILLLTNFSNSPGFITFAEGSGNTAGTDCDILCAINDVTATPSACNSASNTYVLNGQISLFNPPTTGTLTVSTTCGGSVVLNAPFAATVNYSIPNLLPTGGACNVTASFSDDASCSFTQSYTSPAPCANNALNCPQYASVSSSPTTTCGGQVYYLEVENTGCTGTISFNVVGNWGSTGAGQLSWSVTSNLTGAIIASADGSASLNGQNFNVSVGPLNPATTGTIFTLNIDDSMGNGFNGTGGFITIQQPVGTNLLNPIIGDFGPTTSTIFGANISISPATLTVNTPTGPIVNSVNNCKDFKVPITLQNNNFCTTTNVSLPWTIVCQSTGAVISSGTNSVTVYPAIPQNLSDVVDIQFNETTCDWSITTLAGCPQSSLGTIFNVTPNPLSLDPSGSCSGGIENFELQYIGLPSGPNCCVTGGPLETVTYVQTFNNVVPGISPFFAFPSHAAVLTIPPNGLGGTASSLNLLVSVNNYCNNPPSTETSTNYWITIVVDGQIVYDVLTFNPPANNSISINLANIPGGYDESSLVQVYVYPNSVQIAGISTVFNPLLSCSAIATTDARWRADISASIDVTFTEQAPTISSCTYPAAIPYQCCNPVSVSNASTTVCQGVSIAAALNAWGNAVDAANDNCIVFSSITPVAGSIPPNNLIPSSATPGVQTVGAYYYCDTDNNGSINTGDTYTLVSTFTATINAPNTAAIPSSNPSLCLNNPIAPAITIATTGATGIGSTASLPAGVSASFASNTVTISGTPTSSGTFNYAIPLTGGCGSVNASGTITVSDILDFANLQFPANGTICQSGSFTLFGQVFNTGTINTANAGPAAGITAQFGYSSTNTNPATWTNWAAASFNVQAGNNDEYSGTLSGLTPGTYYYTFRYQINGCDWQYGGYSGAGGGVWGGSNVSGVLTVNASPNAGNDGSVTVCATGTPVSLFSALGGGAATTGVWNGPSALTGANLGNFNPASNTAGSYTYTVSVSGCADDVATVSISITSSPSASIAYASPVCNNVINSQTPTINGSVGGTFTESGTLGITSAGAFVPNGKPPGTYSITYTIPAANGCTSFQTQTSVVIQAPPAVPVVSPAAPCASIDSVFTASGSNWYEFLVNGVSTGPPSATNILDTTALPPNSQICVRSYTAPPVIDGVLTDAAWTPVLTGTTGGPTSQSPFTPADTRLDGLKMLNRNGRLYFGVAGNEIDGASQVENNRILLFIDSKTGGFNNLATWTNRSNAGPFTNGVRNLDGGIVFDAGFEADYIVCINRANVTGTTTNFDLYDMAANTNTFLGNSPSAQFGYQESFTENDLTRGFEFFIPLSSLASPTALKVFGMIVNDPGSSASSLVSNQFFSVANVADNNYGSGAIFFNDAAPNPIAYQVSQDCFEQSCVTLSAPLTPAFNAIPSVCQGVVAPALPAATNGITGTWSPTTINTTNPGTTQYTFSPAAGACATTFQTNITITPTPTLTPIYHD